MRTPPKLTETHDAAHPSRVLGLLALWLVIAERGATSEAAAVRAVDLAVSTATSVHTCACGTDCMGDCCCATRAPADESPAPSHSALQRPRAAKPGDDAPCAVKAAPCGERGLPVSSVQLRGDRGVASGEVQDGPSATKAESLIPATPLVVVDPPARRIEKPPRPRGR